MHRGGHAENAVYCCHWASSVCMECGLSPLQHIERHILPPAPDPVKGDEENGAAFADSRGFRRLGMKFPRRLPSFLWKSRPKYGITRLCRFETIGSQDNFNIALVVCHT
jgi:hypothetical protein